MSKKVVVLALTGLAAAGGVAVAVFRGKKTVPPDTGSVVISTTPAGAELMIDGAAVGVSPWSGTVKIGAHSLKATKAGSRDYTSTFNVVAGLNNITATLSLPPVIGSFSISVANLPAEATGWGCAFRDPATGAYYQPTNHPATGSFLFDAAGAAQLSPPALNGVLSISAFSGEGMAVVQLVNHQVPMSATDGGQYVFDFATGELA